MTKQKDICRRNEVTEKQKLTMIELFSGIGAQKEGTDLTGVFDCEVVATADIEKDAMVSYAAIHDGLTNEMIDSYESYPSDEQMRSELIEKNIGFDFKKMTNPIARMKGRNLKKYYLAMVMSKNLGDISKISELPLADFWTYSFPCQDISVAGKQAGIVQGETRSGLLYEVERLLVKAKESDTLPKYLLLENVKNLVGKQFKEQFDDWITRLDELGFNTYWSVVNAKDCGIAQNRERVFAVSIRKDVDTKQFEFMKPFDLGLRLIDFLDDEVDEKYYLSQEIQDRLQITDSPFEKSIIGTTKPEFRTIGQRDLVYQKDGTMGTLVATDYKQPKQNLEDNNINMLGLLPIKGNEQIRRVYGDNGIAPTLNTMQGGNRQPKILEDQKTINNISDKYAFARSKCQEFYNKNGYLPKMFNPYNKAEVTEIAPTQTTMCDRSCSSATVLIKNNKCVRKLTPKECWRLMGFTDEDYEKAVSVGLSDSACYKQAGNSIVTYCIKCIMEHLYKAQYDNTYICFDENFTKPQAD